MAHASTLMKRIIDGRTYNTATSTLVARSRYFFAPRPGAEPVEYEADLYLTRGRAFFAVVNRLDDDDSRTSFEALTREEAAKWLLEGQHELFDESVLTAPPEAAETAEPEATLYVRVPRALKDRIEAATRNEGVSLNSWIMRCAERCMRALTERG
jgi:predicted HicB family RNase H-like nuclease